MPSRNFIDLTGQTFDRLTVVSRAENGPQWRVQWLCRCSCGNMIVVWAIRLRKGNTRSCGCLRAERRIESHLKHGSARKSGPTPEYKAWSHMRDRCHTPSSKDFPRWGGRGITVCERWYNSFEAFLQDVGPRPTPKHTLDRYPDNNGNYEPGNVRWATRTEQAQNTRRTILLTLNSEIHCISEWARILHVKQQMLSDRYKAGWSDERILTTPPRRWPSQIAKESHGSLF